MILASAAVPNLPFARVLADIADLAEPRDHLEAARRP
jgi:hypothetical protein